MISAFNLCGTFGGAGSRNQIYSRKYRENVLNNNQNRALNIILNKKIRLHTYFSFLRKNISNRIFFYVHKKIKKLKTVYNTSNLQHLTNSQNRCLVLTSRKKIDDVFFNKKKVLTILIFDWWLLKNLNAKLIQP